jgi:hypothetical protein
VAVGDDMPQAAESPITTLITAAAMAHRLFVFDSNRRTPDVALEMGRSGSVSRWLVGS